MLRAHLLGKGEMIDQSGLFNFRYSCFCVLLSFTKKSYTASYILLTTPKLKISDLGVISPRRASGAI